MVKHFQGRTLLRLLPVVILLILGAVILNSCGQGNPASTGAATTLTGQPLPNNYTAPTSDSICKSSCGALGGALNYISAQTDSTNLFRFLAGFGSSGTKINSNPSCNNLAPYPKDGVIYCQWQYNYYTLGYDSTGAPVYTITNHNFLIWLKQYDSLPPKTPVSTYSLFDGTTTKVPNPWFISGGATPVQCKLVPGLASLNNLSVPADLVFSLGAADTNGFYSNPTIGNSPIPDGSYISSDGHLIAMASGKATDTGPDPQKRDPGYYQPNGQSCGGPPCDQCSGQPHQNYPVWGQCNNEPWANDPYDHEAGKTICDSGCALTDYAMALSAAGLKLPDGTAIDPGSLNTWLKNNGGYNPDGTIDWTVIQNQFHAPMSVVGSSDSADVDAALAKCKPVLIAATTTSGSHFELVTKKNTCGKGYFIINPKRQLTPPYAPDAYYRLTLPPFTQITIF